MVHNPLYLLIVTEVLLFVRVEFDGIAGCYLELIDFDVGCSRSLRCAAERKEATIRMSSLDIEFGKLSMYSCFVKRVEAFKLMTGWRNLSKGIEHPYIPSTSPA